jgi:hypothetical protein
MKEQRAKGKEHMKRSIIFALCSLLFALCAAGMPAAQAQEFERGTIPKQTAVVRIMNKAAGKAQTVNLSVDREYEYDRLKITVRACQSSAPYSAQDNFMFARVEKKSANAKAQIFSGWMVASDPGYNPLQDADYDLWLVRCE